MNELYPKFRTKAGKLTMYAFACGYLEERKGPYGHGSLGMECGVYHVKGMQAGKRFWECFDKVQEARRYMVQAVPK